MSKHRGPQTPRVALVAVAKQNLLELKAAKQRKGSRLWTHDSGKVALSLSKSFPRWLNSISTCLPIPTRKSQNYGHRKIQLGFT